jgi:integrase
MGRPKLDTPNYRLARRQGRFYVRWWESGAWKRISAGTSIEREAQVFLAQFIAGQGTPEPPPAPTVEAIVEGYLADRKQAVRHYERLEMAAKPLCRHLGDLQPDHLTKERIRFYRARRQAEGHPVGPADAQRKKSIADGTLIRELGMLRAALQWAKREKWISGDLPHIEMPEQPPPRDKWLTRDEADRLLASAKAFHVRVFLSLCLYTAGRGGAIRELTWDRVDFDGGLINLGHVSGGKSRAVVPMSDKLRPILMEARQGATCPYVIEYAGQPVHSLKTATRGAARRAGLPGVTPHVLRHTAATWMAMAKVPMDQIGRLLGHRDVRTTWRIYAKYSPDYLRGAIEALSG